MIFSPFSMFICFTGVGSYSWHVQVERQIIKEEQLLQQEIESEVGGIESALGKIMGLFKR
jgi:hypothetical protein